MPASLMRAVRRQMRPADAQRQEGGSSLRRNPYLQGFVCFLASASVTMHYPLMAAATGFNLKALVFTLMFMSAMTLGSGVRALLGDARDPSARRSILWGARVAWALAAIVPLSLGVIIYGPNQPGRTLPIVLVCVGVAVLLIYLRYARRYRSLAESVA